MRLFHIARRAAWEAATDDYRPPSLGEVGFIHLSTRVQWLPVIGRVYRGVADLVLLEIDAELLPRDRLRFERVDGEDFPHLYAPLPTHAVKSVHDLPAIDELPTRVVATPAFDACVRAADPHVAEVLVCRIVHADRPTIYVCLGARADAVGEISLRDVMRALALLPPADRFEHAGYLQLGPFPRDEHGELDVPRLLVRVHAAVQHD